MELLLGCGSNREKKIGMEGRNQWDNLVTLDHNHDHYPDVVHDLENVPLPFEDNSFNEIHAYDVLEHTGRQGDWRFFFDQWADFWRILKPGGLFMGIVPSPKSVWVWGDPSHTRIIPIESLTFLSQKEYSKQVGLTPMTDFRFYYKADFEILQAYSDDVASKFILRAVK